MNYYLRTLEGLGDIWVNKYSSYPIINAYFAPIVDKYFKAGYSIKDRYIAAFREFVEDVPRNAEEVKLICDYIADFDNAPGNQRGFAEIARQLRAMWSRNYQKAQAQAAAAQQAAAREQNIENILAAEAAEAEAAEASEATRARQQAAAQQAAAEAAAAYAAAMEAQQAAAVVDEAQQVINEGATMEQKEISITPQVVNVEHEYYIIDEDENTITYQDETGKMYVEQKAGSGLGWIIAAAVGAFLLL